MRGIRRILLIIDDDNPGAILDTIVEDGASAEGYALETYDIEVDADIYFKVIKE